MTISTLVAAKSMLNFDHVVGTLLSEDIGRKNQVSSFDDSLTMVRRGRPQDRGKDNNRRRSKSTK